MIAQSEMTKEIKEKLSKNRIVHASLNHTNKEMKNENNRHHTIEYWKILGKNAITYLT